MLAASMCLVVHNARSSSPPKLPPVRSWPCSLGATESMTTVKRFYFGDYALRSTALSHVRRALP